MDRLAKEILKELLPAEKEIAPAPKRGKGKDATVAVDHWTPAILLERGRYLRELARHGDGQASETLKEYPQHHAMLSFRARDGVAELHEKFADVFYVLAGGASLVTGGTVAGAHSVAPGEIRGDRVDGGLQQQLRAGDVAHVPAGVPHQMLVASDKTVTCLVMKIRESE